MLQTDVHHARCECEKEAGDNLLLSGVIMILTCLVEMGAFVWFVVVEYQKSTIRQHVS